MKSKRTVCARCLVFATVATLAIAVPVQAIVIDIDPGKSGQLLNEIVIPFDQLAGTSLLGQSLSLDLLFDQGQFARLFTVTTDYTAGLRLRTGGSGLVGFLNGTACLLDATGSPMTAAQDLGRASSDTGWMYAGLHPLLPGLLDAPFDFFGVRYDLTLPMNTSFSVTAAEFHLFSATGPFGIGPDLPVDVVPDGGGTALLLLVGLFAIIGTRRMDLRILRRR